MTDACFKSRPSSHIFQHTTLGQSADILWKPCVQKDSIVLWIISMHSLISSSLITSGGASRMISPCVGLARSPLSRSRKHTFQASYSTIKGKRKKTLTLQQKKWHNCSTRYMGPDCKLLAIWQWKDEVCSQMKWSLLSIWATTQNLQWTCKTAAKLQFVWRGPQICLQHTKFCSFTAQCLSR